VIAVDEGLLQTGPKATSGDYVIAEDGPASALRNGSASQAAFNVALGNNMAGRMPSLVRTSTNRYSFGDPNLSAQTWGFFQYAGEDRPVRRSASIPSLVGSPSSS